MCSSRPPTSQSRQDPVRGRARSSGLAVRLRCRPREKERRERPLRVLKMNKSYFVPHRLQNNFAELHLRLRPAGLALRATPARQLLLSCRATSPLRGGEFFLFSTFSLPKVIRRE